MNGPRAELLASNFREATLTTSEKQESLPDGAADQMESAIVVGAIAALRKRAEKQAELARAGSSTAKCGAIIRTGEATIAERLANAFGEVADELASGGGL